MNGITNIKYMKRKNLGNYEHEEITVEAVVGETGSPEETMVKLVAFVNNALNGASILPLKEVVSQDEVVAVKEDKPKASIRAAKNKAEVKSEVSGDVPPVIPQEAVEREKSEGSRPLVGKSDAKDGTVMEQKKSLVSASIAKGTVMYDSTVKEQRSRFATYLGTTFPKWKTAKPVEAIKEFSLGLQGKPFEDAKGEMLPSFKEELQAFFG